MSDYPECGGPARKAFLHDGVGEYVAVVRDAVGGQCDMAGPEATRTRFGHHINVALHIHDSLVYVFTMVGHEA